MLSSADESVNHAVVILDMIHRYGSHFTYRPLRFNLLCLQGLMNCNNQSVAYLKDPLENTTFHHVVIEAF